MTWIDKLNYLVGGLHAPHGVELADTRLFEGVRIGGALSQRDLAGLARRGFRAVVRIGHEGEPGQLQSASVEASWAHAFDLEHRRVYLHGLPRGEHVEELRRALTLVPRPAYLHSGGDERAAALAIVLLALERQLDADRALTAAAASGLELRDESLRAFVAGHLAESVELSSA